LGGEPERLMAQKPKFSEKRKPEFSEKGAGATVAVAVAVAATCGRRDSSTDGLGKLVRLHSRKNRRNLV
jgi:hypothetical protein